MCSIRISLFNIKLRFKHYRTYASTILKITYDLDVDIDSDYLFLVGKALEYLSPTRVPGAFWVEFLPFLKHIPAWVPGASFKKHAEKGRPLIRRMRDEQFDKVKKRMVSQLRDPESYLDVGL